MSDGDKRQRREPWPVSNEEIMAALDNLQERLETLVDMTQRAIHEIRERDRSPLDPKVQMSWTKINSYPCGCVDVFDRYGRPINTRVEPGRNNAAENQRCPAHVGIANMTHPERP